MSLITPERPSREYEVAAYQDPAPIKEHRPVRDLGRRLWAMLVGAGAFLLKFGAILYKLKFVTIAGSMIISIGAYALLGGWWFGVGLVALILSMRWDMFLRCDGRAFLRRLRCSSPSWAP